jgi:hypothetical protein
MSRFSKRRPSAPMVVALLALFVALGGTGYAALKLPKNSVGAKQLKKNAVTGPKIKNDSIAGADIKEAKLGPVPLAFQAANSTKLDGVAAGTYVRRPELQPEAVHLLHQDVGYCYSQHDLFCSSTVPWGNHGGGYAPVGYRKDAAGWVYLQGVADFGAKGAPIFFLPEGYRPTDATHEFSAVACGSGAATYVDVHLDGEVDAGAACMTLDNVMFHP